MGLTDWPLNSSSSTLALSDRILEITNLIAGPTTGRILADLGADVIKVEPPGSGSRGSGSPSASAVAREVAKARGLPRSEVYAAVVRLRGGGA